VTNRRRAEIANQAHSDLLIRLHCDGAKGNGFAVYVPMAKGLVDHVSGPSDQVINQSLTAGRKIYGVLARELHGVLKANGLKPDTATAVGRQHGALVGSIFAQEPVVLVEMVNLSSRTDEAYLTKKSGQKQMARALADAVMAALEGRREQSRSGHQVSDW
jgi:N-acetylmuramoyl-L-alanine amidase